jgi:hypothetical protein
MIAAALADEDAFALRWRHRDDRVAYERIVKQDVGVTQHGRGS